MRFGPGVLSAGIAALLLTAGCKEGRPISQQQQGGEQASAPQTAEQVQKQAQQATPQQAPPTGAESQAQAQPPQEEAQPPVAEAPVTPAPTQGDQLIIGEVLTASAQEVLVSSGGEPQIRLQVQPGTVIIVDGREARATDIEEGSQVRASFHDQDGEPTATRIEVTTSRQRATPADPESGESSPGAEPQEPPFQED